MPENKKILLEGYRDLKRKIASESSQSLRNTLDKLGDTIIFRYRYCPDVEAHPTSLLAAKAVVAAENQRKSEEVYQTIAGLDSEYTEAYILQVAEQLQLDIPLFQANLESQETEERIKQDIEDAKNSGLSVFPGLTIDGIPYKGAWDDDSVISTIEKRGGRHIKMAIEGFFHWGASAAAVLIVATLAALFLVNFGFQETYEHVRHMKLGFSFGDAKLLLPLEIWINDFLMAIFFLMIGLEIKKEVVDGELSDMKRAAMPVIGAIGGMFIPALIYVVINVGSETSNGWGIPMATDIAFTLGLMALLGKRVPISLKIFISALAVADDLGAIVVIALFYGHGFHIIPFLIALVIIGVMFFLNRRKVFNISVYVILGIALWFCVFESGLHATLAGVITAILIPVRSSANLTLIAEQTTIIFDREVNKVKDADNPQTKIGHESLEIIRNAIERLREPSEYL
ncbi:MAG: Na+/H+ antiporter NhaA, partial [Bacteroidota bacterium]